MEREARREWGLEGTGRTEEENWKEEREEEGDRKQEGRREKRTKQRGSEDREMRLR